MRARLTTLQDSVKSYIAQFQKVATNLKTLISDATKTAEEKAAAQTQAAPLGLNGDTVKKKKKKKVKGAKKERLQDKAPTPKAPLEETPSKAPDRGTPLEGVHGTGTPAPKPSDTTLPPATTPPASNPPDGGQPPATPGSPIPTPPPQ